MADSADHPASEAALGANRPANALLEQHRVESRTADSSPIEFADARRGTFEQIRRRPPVLVALCSWLVPGLGYWLLGLRARAVTAGVTILLLFVLGIFVGGIRVIDVPGYAEGGVKITGPDGRWTLVSRPMGTVLQKPWYLGQILAGPVTLIASYASVEAAANEYPKGTAHVAELGTLYCAVAGMLNLLILIDATGRAAEAN